MLDELELIFLIDDIVFEVDRRERGLRGWLEEMYHDGEQAWALPLQFIRS